MKRQLWWCNGAFMPHWLRAKFAWVLMALMWLSSPMLLAAPKQLTLKYSLLQQGVQIGTVTDQLSVTGNRYQIQSIVEGIGVYKLAGERTLSSRGTIVANALRPDRFEVQQSKRPNKNLISEFDWAKKVLNMQIKNAQETGQLMKGAQDLLSVMYCWMWQPPEGSEVSVAVATGKKLSQQTFVIGDESEPLQTEAGTFNVLKLTDAEGEKTLYLAKDQNYLPVKLVVEDNGKHLEQVITSVTGQ